MEHVEPFFIDLMLSDNEDDALAQTATCPESTMLAIKQEQEFDLMRSFHVHKHVHSTSSASSSSLTSLTSLEADIPMWPSDFYAVEILYGFDKCKSAKRAHGNVGDTFKDVFKTWFCQMTFYKDHKTLKVPAAAWDAALKAGRTPEGLWTYFLKHS